MSTDTTLRLNARVGDLYHAHQLAWEVMRKGRDNVRRDFLFRFHRLDDATLFQFRPVDKPFDFKTGAEMGFTLNAAPCVRTDEGRKNLVARSIMDADSAVAWMNKQAARNGFEIGTIEAHSVNDSCVKNGSRFGLVLWTFSGSLTVLDADRFNRAMQQGIGRMRSFGQGMLVVKTFSGATQ